jgi:hypothetical protein
VKRSTHSGYRTIKIGYEVSSGNARGVAGVTQLVMNQKRRNGSERIVGGSTTFSDSKVVASQSW